MRENRASSTEFCWQVVVVDDVVRFALHVWSYLARRLGFGIGAVTNQDSTFFGIDEEPRALETPEGDGGVWWVPASKQWKTRLSKILQKYQGVPTLFLVDVNSKHENYSYREIVEWASRKTSGSSEVWVVSSYAMSSSEMEPPASATKFQPKTPGMLQQVARWRDRRESQGDPAPRGQGAPVIIGESRFLDVLVTGAGFELQSDQRANEAEKRDRSRSHRYEVFGVPETPQLLHRMGSPFNDPDGDFSIAIAEPQPVGSLPVPVGGSWQEHTTAFRTIKEIAADRDLDAWWDQLLEKELRERVEGLSNPRARKEDNRRAREHEVRMREAFRNSVLRYDWGHLRHCLEVARLPWCAWLSTNYTRFADRAIAATAQSRARWAGEASRSNSRWRIVATMKEAQLLIHDLHDVEPTGAPEALAQPSLFKLHGDISHLQSMAIAGHDKGLFSLLTVPVEGLKEIYNAAERFLLRKLHAGDGEAKLRWHIVGHGLRDSALLDIIYRVTQARPEAMESFRVVMPKPQEACEKLTALLDDLRVTEGPWVVPVALEAEAYMARRAREFERGAAPSIR